MSTQEWSAATEGDPSATVGERRRAERRGGRRGGSRPAQRPSRGASGAGPALLVVVLLLLGVLAGYAVVASLGPRYQVSTLLDTAAGGPGGTVDGPSSDQADRVVQAELLRIDNDAFRSGIADYVGQPSADVEATQVGTTDVIRITASADRAQVAVATAQAAAGAYLQARTTRLDQEIDAVLAEASVAQTASSGAVLPPSPEQDSALAQQYALLLQRAADLRLVRASLDADVAVLQPATDEGVTPARSPWLGAAVGGLAGLCLGLLLGAAWRARRSAGRREARLEDDLDGWPDGWPGGTGR